MTYNSLQEIYVLERLAGGNTFVHRLNSMVKLSSALVFIVFTASFDRFAFSGMVPYIFYPVILMDISETPYILLLKRFLIALPFCLFAGIPALFIERDAALFIGGLEISTGLLSFVTVIFKAYLCVMAVLLLVATTPLIDMGIRLRRLGVPDILIMLFEMTYRYIGVLVEEASSMFRAYSLRSGGGRGIEMRHMGSFMGQLVLRSFDRAERVYAAMRCRGYGEKLNGGTGKWGKDLKAVDVIFLATVCAFCGFFRVFPY